MPTRREVVEAFEAIAEEFDASRVRPWPETLAFVSTLSTAARILDVGCGGGRNLVVLKQRGCSVVGLDASTRLLVRAGGKDGRSTLVRGDAVSLPFRGESFDGVHCVAVIHHLPSAEDRLGAAVEIVRVLRSGGRALLSAWAIEQARFSKTKSPDVQVPWHTSDGRFVGRFYHLFRRGELEAVSSSAGLSVERAWREGDNHVVLAVKP